MIDDVTLFLKNQLNEYLKAQSGWGSGEPGEERVTLLDGENMEPVTFKLGSITTLLINIEQENVLRPPELFRRALPDGSSLAVQPEIRLNLYVLFVAHFKKYENGLRALSLIIRYFQNHRVLDPENAPDLPECVEQLIVELVTLPFQEQNEVWNALRATYHPSVLYKVSLVVFRDEEGASLPELDQVDVALEIAGAK